MIQFLVSLLATLSFAVLFSAPRKELLFCGLTGAIGWVVYIISLDLHTNAAIANLIATLTLTLVARTLSAIRRNPVTIYLLTGIFPLVPGAGIYYTSYYFIMGEMHQFSQYGISTIKVAGCDCARHYFLVCTSPEAFQRAVTSDSPELGAIH